MNCYKFLLEAILVILGGAIAVIYSDRSRSEFRPDGNIAIKLSGGLLVMFGILLLLGSLIGMEYNCQPTY
jgi:hypothetical protein